MTIHVYSFDFDGCLFNDTYYDIWEKRDKFRHKDNPNEVLLANKDLLDGIIESQKGKNETKIAFIGSNRQDDKTDHYNSQNNESEPSFTAIQTVAEHIGATFHPFLLADIYQNRAHGQTHQDALEALDDRNPITLSYKRDEWAFDETKATILYAQMQKVANENPGEQIIFDFYDDRDDILNDLKEFFSKNPDLIPNTVTLNLHQYCYDDTQEKLSGPIPFFNKKGTGFIDMNYPNTVKKMAEIAEQDPICDEQGRDTGMINTAKHVSSEQLNSVRVPLVSEFNRQQLDLLFLNLKEFEIIMVNSGLEPQLGTLHRGLFQELQKFETDFINGKQDPKDIKRFFLTTSNRISRADSAIDKIQSAALNKNAQRNSNILKTILNQFKSFISRSAKPKEELVNANKQSADNELKNQSKKMKQALAVLELGIKNVSLVEDTTSTKITKQ